MKSKLLLLFLLVVPAVFWVFFEKVKINSRRLNYYGPKTVKGRGDTLFHQVPDSLLPFDMASSVVVIPINEKYAERQYHLQSILEALRFRPEKLSGVPLIFLKLNNKNYDFLNYVLESKADVQVAQTDSLKFVQLNNAMYIQKPYYVFDYFGVLLDENRHIRGYYNFAFADEVKRMTQEYQHLRLKEEGKKIKESHVIEQK
jgi:hypothetical protein